MDIISQSTVQSQGTNNGNQGATGSEQDYLSDNSGQAQTVITNAQRGANTETVMPGQEDNEYIELEDEMEIEEALSKLTRRLESLKGSQ